MSEGINRLINRTSTLPLTLRRETWREKLKTFSQYVGPAFIVSVAYIDPGNFATNIIGGSKFNYSLLWVLVWSNLIAVFLQTLSAKLGIATGQDLATHCGLVFSSKVNIMLWCIMFLAAAATYMAEFLGAALGLSLLFGFPILLSGVITIGLTFAIVYLRRFGQQIIERVIAFMLGIIGISYIIELFLAKPDWNQVAVHALVPSLDPESILIAVGMLGATVMPHVIYLHSDLVKTRRKNDDLAEASKHFRMERLDIIVAMNVALLVNAAMVVVAAAVFFANGVSVTSIEEAHQSLTPLLGSLSSGAFGLALLASGLSSSAVGAMAGDCMLKGFIGLDCSPNLRRALTVIPAIVLLWLGLSPLKLLLMSQVTLSFALPAAIIPLLIITAREDIMGTMSNSRITNRVGVVIVSTIVILNGVLIYFSII